MNNSIKYLKLQLFIALLYVFIAKISLLLPNVQFYELPIWPASGLAFAVIYFYGYTYLPALCLAGFAAVYSAGYPADVAVAIAIGYACEAIIGVSVLKYYMHSGEEVFEQIQSTTAFLFGAALASAVTAMIGVAALFFNQSIEVTEVVVTLYKWFASDFLGMLFIAPFLISWMLVPLNSELPSRVFLEKVVASIGLIITSIMSLGMFRNYRYFIFMFLTWIAVRFTLRFVTFSTVIVSSIAFVLFFVERNTLGTSTFENLFFLQTFFGVTQINTLVLSTVITHKKKTEAELRDSREFLDVEVRRRTQKLRISEQRFALALKNTNFIIFNQDKDLKYTWVHNPALGNKVEAMIGKTDGEVFSKKVARVLTPIKQQVINTGKAERLEIKLGTEKMPQYFDLSVEPVINEAGQVEGITAVSIDITERKQQEEKKDEFISIASHELKTPLTSIKGYVQILERKMRGTTDPELKKYLDRTNDYIQKLQRLIGDLLDVSKIQAGKLAMTIEDVDMDQLVAETVESTQHSSDIKITLHGHAGVAVPGDKYRLEQVINNLLNNAIKYSPQADEVVVKVTKKDHGVTVSVRDFGMGIPQQELSKVFQRFYRIEKQTQHISGLGIGLYLSHEIIDRHHGKMWVESQVGKGSTFSFWVPQDPK